MEILNSSLLFGQYIPAFFLCWLGSTGGFFARKREQRIKGTWLEYAGICFTGLSAGLAVFYVCKHFEISDYLTFGALLIASNNPDEVLNVLEKVGLKKLTTKLGK